MGAFHDSRSNIRLGGVTFSETAGRLRHCMCMGGGVVTHKQEAVIFFWATLYDGMSTGAAQRLTAESRSPCVQDDLFRCLPVVITRNVYGARNSMQESLTECPNL